MGIYLVMKNNIKRSLHHKLLFIITLLLPVMICSLFGLIRFGRVTLRVGILDSPNSSIHITEREELHHILNQSEGITYGKAEEESLNTDLRMGRFQIIIDGRNYASQEEYDIISLQPEDKRQLLQAALQQAVHTKQPLSLTGFKTSGLSTTERSITMILSLFFVFATIQGAALIRDKQNGTLTRYQFARKGTASYLIGYLLHTFLITLFQVVLCIAALSMIQDGFILTFGEGLIMTLSITTMSTVYAIVISHLSKSEVTANVIASALAGIFAILGGTFVAIDAMPGLLRALSLASPMRWVVELLQLL